MGVVNTEVCDLALAATWVYFVSIGDPDLHFTVCAS